MLKVICLACDKPFAEFNISPTGTLKFAGLPNGTNPHMFDIDKHMRYVVASMPDPPNPE
jgi:hypothetical protein